MHNIFATFNIFGEQRCRDDEANSLYEVIKLMSLVNALGGQMSVEKMDDMAPHETIRREDAYVFRLTFANEVTIGLLNTKFKEVIETEYPAEDNMDADKKAEYDDMIAACLSRWKFEKTLRRANG